DGEDGEDVKPFAPWDPLGNPDIWPHFIGHCLGFLTTLWIVDPTYLESIKNMVVEEAFVRLPRKDVDKFQKVRHKDLKPEHLRLMWDEKTGLTPLIIDFGISKIYAAGDPTEHEGSRKYLAPEQITGNSASEKSDVFSMACCFTFIEAMLHSGTTGVRQIFEVALSRHGGFRDNIQHVNDILNRAPTVQLSPRMEGFRLELRKLVESKMLVHNVADRSNAGEVFEAFIEIHQNYENGA
ncbi:CAMK kinase, partial [Fusarium sp. NRRL 25303]